MRQPLRSIARRCFAKEVMPNVCGVEIYENEKPGTPVVSGRERDHGSVRSRVKRSRACARRNDRGDAFEDILVHIAQ